VKDVEIPVPETIGRYRVLRPVAQGGMAAVFEVEDPDTRERLALKMLTQRGLAAPRFEREYRALTRLDHPNIVRVYQFGTHEGSPYLTMELLDGVPVQVHCKNQGRPGTPRRTQEVLRVGAEVATALAYLHERGIVHRDLKSANVLVLADARVKLLDFGTARVLGRASDGITRHGEFVGTFAYASPEQIRGEELDPRSDLYSLGVLLYRMSTGKRVFTGDSPHELARKHVREAPIPPSDRVPALPASLNRMVLQLLEKDPAARLQTATEVAEVLTALRRPDPDRPSLPERASPDRLVGREDELQVIEHAVSEGRPGHLVLITGPQGAGRHRLLRRACADARARGSHCFSGRFAEKLGLGPLADIASEVWSTFPSGELPELDAAMQRFLDLEDELALAGGGASPELRNELTTALSMVIVERARRDTAPVVLALDDLHEASPLALGALAGLRHRLRVDAVAVVVCATATDEADAPGSVLRERFGDAQRVEPGPLSVAQVGSVVSALLGGRPASSELAKRIHAAAGGLPGFIEELVRAMVVEGQVVARSARGQVAWVDQSEGKLVIPGSMREAIDMRLGFLDPTGFRVLEALAVAGGDATSETLAHGLDKPLEEVRDSCVDLVDRRLLDTREVAGGERWIFRLGLTRDVVSERLRASRRHVFRRRLADAMSTEPPSARTVKLLLAAGRVDEAVAGVVAWAEPLLEFDQALEVLPVLEAVASCSEQAELTPARVLARCHLLHGRALALVGPSDPNAVRAFRRASSLALTATLKGEVDVYDARMRVARGELATARNLLDRAQQRLDRDGPAHLRARAHHDLGSLHWFAGNFEAASRSFERALAAARASREDRDVARALVARAVIRIAGGGLRAAEVELLEGMALFEGVGDRGGQWHALLNLVEVLRYGARYTEALGMLLPELEVARDSASPVRYAFLVLNAAELEIDLFRLGRARQRLDELEVVLPADPPIHFRLAMALARGRIALASGEPQEALDILAPLVVEAEEAELHILSSHLRAYLGEAQVACGEREIGDRNLRQAVERLDRMAYLPPLAEACSCRARAVGDVADPLEVYQSVLGWMDREPARLARLEFLIASASHHHGSDAMRSRDYAKMGLELLGAIEADQDGEEQQALAVHPWGRHLRRCLDLPVDE